MAFISYPILALRVIMLPMCLEKKVPLVSQIVFDNMNEDCTHAWAQLCRVVCQLVISHRLTHWGVVAPFINPCVESDRVSSRFFRANTF